MAIKIKGLSDVQKNINKLQQEYPEQIAKTMHRIANEIIAESDKNIPVAEGTLRSSSKVDGIRKVKQTGIVNLGYSANYAAAVHEGTRPHWVPIDALIKWVRKKRLTGRYSVKTRRRLDNANKQFLQDFEVARMIQYKIAHNGTKGQKFLERAVLEKQDKILGEVKKDLKTVPRKAGLK